MKFHFSIKSGYDSGLLDKYTLQVKMGFLSI